ncbi:MAG: 1-acyl-sn-glycerol-3-phosphate acyltransferase [Clostridia bacterium]|nr:1-acyl-sn-glycerol-3-phosphate acyltransferase [Clostridia bacterium]MBQ5771250.1 1-acyl-sn-glycerol-3-phosphate acyltransferase [Clostridia bacterium]
MKEKLSKGFKRVVKAVIFFLFRLISRVGLNAHVHFEGEKPSGNAVFFGNHTHMFDFMHLSLALKPHKPHFVVRAREFNRNKFYTWFLPILGLIPKLQGAMDLVAVRTIINTVKSGEPVVVYPEAMTSFDGRNAWKPMQGTGMLARMLGVDIYAAVINGGFITMPRFGGFHRGRVDITIKRIMTAGEAKKASPDQIQAAIADALSFNDWDWQEKNNKRFWGISSVKRLTRYLYVCPACRKRNTLEARKNTLVCSACGLKVTRDAYGFFHSKSDQCPGRLDAWTDIMLEEIREDMKKDDFALCQTVEIQHKPVSEKTYVSGGKGELVLNKNGLSFKGSEEHEWKFDSFQFFVLNDVDFIEINTTQKSFRFIFDDPRDMYRWFFTHREFVR